MSMPTEAPALTIDTLELGKPIGRAWIRLFGLLPIDYDHLTIAALEPGRRFHEKSRLFSAPQWQHERLVEPVDDASSRVTDRLTFTPRRGFGLLGPRIIRLIFWYRHRRLRRFFA